MTLHCPGNRKNHNPPTSQAYRPTPPVGFVALCPIGNGLYHPDIHLYSVLEVFCCFTGTFELHDDREQLVERDGQPLQPGNYYVVTNGRSLLCFNF